MTKRTALTLSFLLCTTAAQAAMLSTPSMFAGEDQLAQCNVTTVGTKPVTVTIELYDSLGRRVAAERDNCGDLPLAPKAVTAARWLSGSAPSAMPDEVWMAPRSSRPPPSSSPRCSPSGS